MSRFMDDDLGTDAGSNPSPGTGSDAAAGGLEGVDGSSSQSSGLKNNIVLLLLVVVIAGGAMFLMRSYSTHSGVELTDVKIDYTFDTSQQSQIDHAIVLQSLRRMDRDIQVPLEAIRMDPFRMDSKTPEEVATTVTLVDPNAEANRSAKARHAAIQKAYDELKLNSVITGSVPIARISGQPVRIGDAVGEFFVVTDIRDRSVTLVADDEMYILAL